MRKTYLSLKDSENGRGMIEMIAVLGIFGLLTIASIGGLPSKSGQKSHSGNTISYALEKTKAVDLASELNERLIPYRMQRTAGNPVLSDMYPPASRGGYPLKFSTFGTNSFSVTVSQLPSGVCRQLILLNALKADRIRINDTSNNTPDSCNRNFNTVTYQFND